MKALSPPQYRHQLLLLKPCYKFGCRCTTAFKQHKTIKIHNYLEMRVLQSFQTDQDLFKHIYGRTFANYNNPLHRLKQIWLPALYMPLNFRPEVYAAVELEGFAFRVFLDFIDFMALQISRTKGELWLRGISVELYAVQAVCKST